MKVMLLNIMQGDKKHRMGRVTRNRKGITENIRKRQRARPSLFSETPVMPSVSTTGNAR